jgi:thioredoxin reductase
MSDDALDVVIVGGGPAGLSCALWLARYRRSVCVLDTGDPRNRPAWAVHGFPGIPDPPPLELRARIRAQAVEAGAIHRVAEVVRVDGEKDSFEVATGDGSSLHARRVVLAYGLRDFVPDLPGIGEFYGHSVYHCPDCDGPAVRDQAVGVIGSDRHAASLALYLLTWTPHVTLLTNAAELDIQPDALDTLTVNGVRIDRRPITALRGDRGVLKEVTFAGSNDAAGGTAEVEMNAMFFHLGAEPRCSFADDRGCAIDEHGFVEVDRGQQTSVHGVYAAGDIAGHPHLASSAAAEGIRAALAIHRSLLPDSFLL